MGITCVIEGCDREDIAGRMLCRGCYARERTKPGFKDRFPLPPRLSDAERFWEKVDQSSADGCWVWTASTVDGYGTFWDRSRRMMAKAHRWIYEEEVGPIPAGYDIDHLCRNRACVRVSHLEAVTHRENVLRGDGLAARQARMTHCKRGHEFTPENTKPQSKGRRGRSCRECHRMRERGEI